MSIDPSTPTATQLRHALLAMAREEEHHAATEAATVRYWEPCPPTVQAHRMAASVLRDAADTLLAGCVA